MRYAARLIFKYRVDGDKRKRTTCESRIVVLEAGTPEDALRRAKARGVEEQTSYSNVDGHLVSIDFVGLADLIQLTPVCDDDEVWYRIFESAAPSKLVRIDEDLSVFRPLPDRIGAAVRFAPDFSDAGSRTKRRRT